MNIYFKKDHELEKKLPNPIYPCCSSFFIYNWKASQINLSEIEWLGLGETKVKRNLYIRKAICSIINKGGGVILGGV